MSLFSEIKMSPFFFKTKLNKTLNKGVKRRWGKNVFTFCIIWINLSSFFSPPPPPPPVRGGEEEEEEGEK